MKSPVRDVLGVAPSQWRLTPLTPDHPEVSATLV